MRGATIGAHGVHHLYLPDQPDDQKRAELLESRRSLEDVIGRSVRLFAYPHGAVDRATAICAREEFHWALTGRTASVHQSFDAASVPRLVVKAWDVRDLAERIAALRLGGPAPVRLVP
jgi:peptidoglycan/xylan/chitin deacetylase (PgdA/CDA1 family)